MKIVLATPLFPPDIEESAMYIMELAKRLSHHHEITIVAYGHLPEQIAGVKIHAVDKSQLLFVRLFSFFLALLQEAKKVDVIYAQNGASVELPISLVSFFRQTHFILHMGDLLAQSRAKRNTLLRLVESLAKKRATRIIKNSPMQKPEILPFAPRPTEELEQYEKTWKEHIRELESVFDHVRKES